MLRNKIAKEEVMEIRIEIRAAEGGDHAKQLVGLQTSIYKKYCERRCL